MKNRTFFLSFLSMLFAFQIDAQSQRIVFIEEATQASSITSASANPALHAKVNSNLDKVVFMAYHASWPGFDPMYSDNEAEIDERISYYNFSFVPQIAVQGNLAAGSSPLGSLENLTQSQIDAINGEISEFNIIMDTEINNNELKVTGSVEATAEVSGDLRLRLAIIERVIHSTDAPGGTNGETKYLNVFKKFINGPTGIDLENAWAVGDSYSINEIFDLSALNIYNMAEIDVIAFVQNDDNKFVHQVESPFLVNPIRENGFIKEFSIFPNPANEAINVHLAFSRNTFAKMEIINALGETILQNRQSFAAGSHQYTIDTYNFPAGVYLFKMMAGGQIWSQKFVVQR